MIIPPVSPPEKNIRMDSGIIFQNIISRIKTATEIIPGDRSRISNFIQNDFILFSQVQKSAITPLIQNKSFKFFCMDGPLHLQKKSEKQCINYPISGYFEYVILLEMHIR